MKFNVLSSLFLFLKKTCFSLFIAKLESEYKAIQLRNKQQYEDQSKELHSAQENMVTLACNVDEVRRKLEKFTIIEK